MFGYSRRLFTLVFVPPVTSTCWYVDVCREEEKKDTKQRKKKENKRLPEEANKMTRSCVVLTPWHAVAQPIAIDIYKPSTGITGTKIQESTESTDLPNATDNTIQSQIPSYGLHCKAYAS